MKVRAGLKMNNGQQSVPLRAGLRRDRECRLHPAVAGQDACAKAPRNLCNILGIKARWALLGFVRPFVLKNNEADVDEFQ